MDGKKILRSGEGASTAVRRKAHPLRIAEATGCVVVVIVELTVHLPNGFSLPTLTCLFLVLVIVDIVISFRRRKSKAKAPSEDGSLLIAETEAFLSGDYASYLRSHRREVPGWAWLNSFAHGELTVLRETQRLTHVLASVSGMAGAEKSWVQAQDILRRDLLTIVQDDPHCLKLVQQSILVPLELRLMELEANAGLTAYELVQATRAALGPRIP
jgi:hypothetical protein